MFLSLALMLVASPRVHTFQTLDARFTIDDGGRLTSIRDRASGREYIPKGEPSSLITLVDGFVVGPSKAEFNSQKSEYLLHFYDSVAAVKVEAKPHYLKLQLVSLTNRERFNNNITWGPLYTRISKRIGDLIGVVHDDDFAIGMMGLDDNTIAGPPVDGDCYGMGYYIHSPDPKRYPLPPQYKEGQHFNIGGDGVSDTAFYSHPEEYFQQIFGNGAKLEPGIGSSITYHSRDRRKPYAASFSLLPGFKGSRPRHQVTDAVNVDYIGSQVAIYACPSRDGLKTIERIELAEGLPHPVSDGKWIHDPTTYKPDIAWYGPHDRLIEYADALGLKAVQDEGQGEYYANPADHWQGLRVKFKNQPSQTYKQFTDQTNRHGIKYGLHTLCLFLQSGRCTDVSPGANPHLQTVLRTKLANSITATDTHLEVTDPSFLAEDGTWPMRDGANYLRIGTELLTYTGITDHMFQGIKRGVDGTNPQPHAAREELDKLQMNCYNGFCPDMELMPKYADYYATVMVENGMKYIDFDGLESCLYQNQGCYGLRQFLRRLFKTYAKLTGGQCPRVMGSAVFAGGWEYMSVCNVGGGNNMFDPVLNRWGIEGKDVRNGFSNSYFAATFGIQDYHSDWSLYDAENLEAKSLGWNAMYMLGLSQEAVEKSGEKDAIFKSLRAWENARALQVFTPSVCEQLKDLNLKFHLEQTGKGAFELYPVKEVRSAMKPEITLSNSGPTQPLQFAIQFKKAASGVAIILPDGRVVRPKMDFTVGQFLLCKGAQLLVADKFRKVLSSVPMDGLATLPSGMSRIKVECKGDSNVELTAWIRGKGRRLHS